ncbi:MAG: hypothetical protein QG604_206 [Candidatus Dependentiae bacterium]|nr:hypothetical protein [Candidatus Dependentiae bacterium]
MNGTLHKRKFGKKGYVAVLMPEILLHDTELMGRVDAAAVQFGVSHEYGFTYFKSRYLPHSTYCYVELMELAAQILAENYITIMTVGPEAFNALNEVTTRLKVKPMIIGINCQDALDTNQPQQYEMLNMHHEYYPNLSNLVRVCLEKNLSQDEGIAYIQKYEAARERKNWGIFDDCYVILKSRSGAQQMVRFEDREDVILPPAPEHPFLGRGRIILFQA